MSIERVLAQDDNTNFNLLIMPYKDPKTLACIQMNAILANMKTLCDLDQVAKDLIANQSVSITFKIISGPCLTLAFNNGRCEVFKGQANGSIQLLFLSYEHFCRVMDNKSTPIMLWGFHKLRFLLKVFNKLTQRLECYLRADETQLKNPEFQKINTLLMARVAVNASIEVGNHDPQMEQIRHSFPEGVMCFGIKDELNFFIQNHDGQLELLENGQKTRAYIIFKDINSACSLLNGKSDTYSNVADGNLNVKGYIPMLDHFDKYLFKVSHYLK